MGVFLFVQGLLKFYAKDRLSLLLFLGSTLGAIWIFTKVELTKTTPGIEITEGVRLQLELIDSLRLLKSQPRRFEFNPNFLSEYNAYVWGVSDSALLRLEAFRAGGHWLRSAKEFQRVTGVSDSLLAAMELYFRFPEWTQNPISNFKAKQRLPEIRKDLNQATAEDLQTVYGIGPVLSERIIQFKERYGDFKDSLQLRLVYGLKPAAREELLKYFQIKNSEPILKFNINQVSASDLATLPGVSFELAREIVIFRRLHGRIDSAEDLLSIDGISADRLAGIAVYLQFD